MLAENMHFFIAYFLAEKSKFETITGLQKIDKFVSNLLFMNQMVANSTNLPPKNGGLKAWSHSVRKAHCIIFPGCLFL